ncbi:MAG: HEPN domain-containing protein [Candidatus Thorarchaeota archaeon]|nr:HEPN domain-containing protein [Candidatus Thorarchaeota archaeon]
MHVEEWFSKSDTYADLARVSVQRGHHDAACFLAQQAVEFFVKGLLIVKTGAKAYSHSLLELFAALASTGLKVPDNVSGCTRLLSGHYLQARYPDARLDPYTSEESTTALECMEVILDFLRRVRSGAR